MKGWLLLTEVMHPILQWLHTQMQSESVKDWRTGPTWTPNYNSNYYLNWLLDLNTAVNAHIEATSYNGVRYRDVVNYH